LGEEDEETKTRNKTKSWQSTKPTYPLKQDTKQWNKILVLDGAARCSQSDARHIHGFKDH
jgi:hypothetical protein